MDIELKSDPIIILKAFLQHWVNLLHFMKFVDIRDYKHVCENTYWIINHEFQELFNFENGVVPNTSYWSTSGKIFKIENVISDDMFQAIHNFYNFFKTESINKMFHTDVCVLNNPYYKILIDSLKTLCMKIEIHSAESIESINNKIEKILDK